MFDSLYSSRGLLKVGEWTGTPSVPVISRVRKYLAGSMVFFLALFVLFLPPTNLEKKGICNTNFAGGEINSHSPQVRVALLRGTAAAGFQVTGSYRVINENTGDIIGIPRPGERWEIEDAGGLLRISREGKPVGAFKGPVLICETPYIVNIYGSKDLVEKYSTSEMAVLGDNGKIFSLAGDMSDIYIESKWGVNGLQPESSLNLVALYRQNGDGGAFSAKKYRGSMQFSAAEDGLLAVNMLSVESYLRGVIPREMPGEWPLEALKAQAVAARSYALAKARDNEQKAFDVLATDYSQVYGGYDAETPLTDRAVQETEGIVMTFNNEIVYAFYHASSGGFIENSEDVWNEPLPYIRSRNDPFDKNDKFYNWQVSYKQNQLVKLINEKLKEWGHERIFASINDLQEIADTSTGVRVRRMKFTGTGEDGQPLTVILQNADRVRVALGLRSAFFTYQKQVDASGKLASVTFTGSGWGHGLGMSQYGSRGMARQGNNYRQILQYYYRGVEIKPDYGRF